MDGEYSYAEATHMTCEEVYKSSFETESDSTLWKQYGARIFNEGAPNGGNRSLIVANGCTDYVCLVLDTARCDRLVTIDFWAKSLLRGGVVSLSYHREHPLSNNSGIGEHILDTIWTHYPSQDTLVVLSGEQIFLSMFSGGFISGAILVDLIDICSINLDCHNDFERKDFD